MEKLVTDEMPERCVHCKVYIGSVHEVDCPEYVVFEKTRPKRDEAKALRHIGMEHDKRVVETLDKATPAVPGWRNNKTSQSVQVLQRGIDLTTGDRADTYGDCTTNLTCAGQLWDVYKRFAGDKYSPAHEAAMQQILAKISRIACGKLHDDNYVDGATYFAIALEVEINSGGE